MPTTYLSPGVYVEEVPSAQQPIAGVGTSTAGFIGIVPDFIKVPVPNDSYDPHLAQVISRGEGTTDKSKQEYASARQQLAALVDDAKKKDRKETADLAAVAELEGKLNEAKKRIEAIDEELKRTGDAAVSNERKNQLNRERARLDKDRVGLEGQLTKAQENAAKGITDEHFLRPYRMEPKKVEMPVLDAKLCTNFTEYTEKFGAYSSEDEENGQHRALTHAVAGFFKNGGTRCWVIRIASSNGADIDNALHEFESIDEIALVAAPGVPPSKDVWGRLVAHCALMNDRFAILDPPKDVGTGDDLAIAQLNYGTAVSDTIPDRDRNAAYYFPWLEVIDPAKQLMDQDPTRRVDPNNRGKIYVPPSGHIAGMYARVDTERGVHKAPGNEAILGVNDLRYYIGSRQQDSLNPQGVNCIRNLNGNIRVYGARTIGGDKNGEWKYVNVRRVMLFLKESIDEGTQWVVFEPNDPALWAKIRRNVGAFLTNVWRSGALLGTTPQQAFYVKCDEETNPPEVRDVGQVITEIGVAIVRPAEFVIFRVTQWAGPTKS